MIPESEDSYCTRCKRKHTARQLLLVEAKIVGWCEKCKEWTGAKQ